MNYYSDSEVNLLVEDLSAIAKEAIEQAGAEAAKAAALSALDREAALLQQRAAIMREAERWKLETETAKNAGIKNAVLAGVICFIGGLVVGVGGVLIIGGR
jgi:DNA-directed RNA polymerase